MCALLACNFFLAQENTRLVEVITNTSIQLRFGAFLEQKLKMKL